jgi:hypothetical protein
MFQAGAASAAAAARRPWAWPALAATLALVAAGETVALATRPVREVVVQRPAPPAADRAPGAAVEILARSEVPASARDQEPWSGGEPLSLRRQILRFGLEGLPDPPPLLSQTGVPQTGSAGDFGSPEPLRRYELNKMLNLGGPS